MVRLYATREGRPLSFFRHARHFMFPLLTRSFRLHHLLSLLLAVFSLATVTPVFAATWTPLEDEAEERFNLQFDVTPAVKGDLKVFFDYRDDNNTYVLECASGRAAFISLAGGKRRVLAAAPVSWKPQNSVTLQRRSWLMRLVVNGQVVLTGFDSTYLEGNLGAVGTGWAWKNQKVQPVEPIRFDDDFTRAGSQGDSTWKPATGKWQLTASSNQINAKNAEMSSNPFAYEALAGNGLALSTAGRWFWDNYDVRAALKPEGRSPIGLAVYVQDAKNYLSFVWSPNEGPEARRLLLVKDGKTTVLAKGSGAFLPRQWYQLGVRTSPGFIEAIIDGVPVLRARDNNFGQGGIGLIAEGNVAFDDVTVRSYEFYRQDFQGREAVWSPEQEGPWLAKGGNWSAKDGLVTSAPKAGEGGKTRMLLVGRPEWDGYQVLASAQVTSAGAGGLVAGYKDDGNFTVFRWAGPSSTLPFKNRQQVMAYSGGKATILSDAPLSLNEFADKSGFVRLNLRWDLGALTMSAGGRVITQTSQATGGTGQLALWAQSMTPASFKDVVILFPPAAEKQKVAPKMEDDAYMVGWASASGEWPPISGDKGLEFWNSGEFFGDTTVEFPWRSTWMGSMEWALRAKRGNFPSGYILKLESSDDKTSLILSIQRQGKVVASNKIPLSMLTPVETDAGIPLRLSLVGGGMTLYGGGKGLISYLDPEPLTGTAFAARSLGFRVRSDRLSASSANRDDYTFNEAPTDFYAPQGEWSVFSRWPCYGDWSFFGGYGQAATLWSKRTYGGDAVVEMYAHNQMELPKEVGYSHPGDLNISLAGDGLNPSSGYSFIVGGWNNTRSKVLRGNEVIGESFRPEARFEKTINHNMKWHRRWVYIRAEARRAVENGQTGVRLKLIVDDTELVSFFDAKPLPYWEKGGRVAFWTVDGTLMIARAKIESEKPGLKGLPAGLIDPVVPVQTATTGQGSLSPVPTLVDKLPTSVVSLEDGAWKITNPGSGGWFETKWNSQSIEVKPESRLSFRAQIPAGVNVDAYVQIGDDLHLIELTGNQRPDAKAPSLGKASLTLEENSWQAVRFDLGAALARKFPGQRSWTVNGLFIGAVHGDYYRFAGFGGNAYGASFRVADMKLEAAG